VTSSAADHGCAALRRAEAGDRDAVLSLLSQLELPTAGVVDLLARFWVAVQNDRVVGVAGMERYGDAGLLRSVAVAPEWQGGGVGRALVERVLDEGRAEGIREVYLLTTTAEHYFPRIGFVCVARSEVPGPLHESEEFKGACPSSAVTMRKPLTTVGNPAP
jgi:amino-acid N-acetyltransferase